LTSGPASSRRLPIDSSGRASDLERELARTVRGEVRFDPGSRALYATDASNYRQVPIGLVVPHDADDVIAAVAACRKYGAPVLPRGGGTSLAGQCCNVAVVLDFSKYMSGIIELDPVARYARVQPGVVLDTLRSQAERQRLTFGPDPSTHSRCTLGGMIGNNSCGTHSLMAGKTVDNVEELRVLLYDGTVMTVGATSEQELAEIVKEGGRRGDLYARLRDIRNRHAESIRTRFPNIPRRVSGYNLDELLPENGFHVARALVGTEGTCAVVLDAKLKLIASPQHRTLVGLGYADTFAAADHVPEILQLQPIGLEGFEGAIVDSLRRKGAPNLDLIPDGRGFLIVEFGADDPDTSSNLARALVDRLAHMPTPPAARIYTPSEARAVWKIRESGPRAANSLPGAVARWEGWDDAAVHPERLGPYLRELRRLLDAFGYDAAFYGHFGHGCIHMQVTFDLESEPGIRKYAEFVDQAADLVVRYGGSLSGEHGDGQARGVLLPKMFGPELMDAFRAFKAAWDPDNRMNPGKVIDAFGPTENLRLGADYRPRNQVTHFRFPDDSGSFAKASLRCVGLGECRKLEGGTMCPSYLATREEAHSTRGRAHMLFELLQDDVLAKDWQDDHVKDAMELCLSCKACKVECPTNVDIATYRAEFLAHYYDGRRRPIAAYGYGLIDRWARLASMAPGLANGLAALPLVRRLTGNLLKMAPSRQLPRFARQSFSRWARARGVAVAGAPRVASTDSGPGRQDVVLWVDTFNNYFHPETTIAALNVLEAAGCRVTIPSRQMCCGRPLYDFGMLDRAKAYLRDVMDGLSGAIDASTPVVVLEPSCASVFRDELGNLFPDDERAARLRKQTLLLSEFLSRHATGYQPPRLKRHVLLHGHCHHKALWGVSDEETLVRKAGADVEAPDSGCCGMAGPFGYDRDKFEVSQAIGERVLLPAVRRAAHDTLIVADGFSCREQIGQLTGRQAIHLAEALQLGLPEAHRR
jgi:FAD/FMN-containing dehydrogenase/Fe-S oxidoreductase